MLHEAGDHLGLIGEAYERLKEKFWDVGPACANAYDAVPIHQRKEFISRLPFSRSNYSKWIAIGKSTPDLDKRMREIIPPRLSVAYEFVQLTPVERVKFIEGRAVKSPPLQRDEIVRWKKKNRPGPSIEDELKAVRKPKSRVKADLMVPGRFYGALKPKRNLTSSEMEALDKRLNEIAKEYDLELAFPPIPPGKDTTTEVHAYMRKNINKMIRDTLTARAEAFPARKKSLMALATDLRIWPDDDEQRMRDSLDEIDQAHEFDRIRSEAYKAHPMEEPGQPEWVDAVENKSHSTSLHEEEVEEIRKTISQTSSHPARIFGLPPDERRARLSGIT